MGSVTASSAWPSTSLPRRSTFGSGGSTGPLSSQKDGRNRVSVARVGSSDAWAAESGPSAVRLVWSEAYECGERNIDTQHHELFKLANAALAASFKSKAYPGEFEVVINRLLSHIVIYFAYEEKALGERDYDELQRHKADHAALLRQAGELRVAAKVGKATICELIDFLADKVVAQHLFTSDRRFFPLFADQSLSRLAAQ